MIQKYGLNNNTKHKKITVDNFSPIMIRKYSLNNNTKHKKKILEIIIAL